MEIFEILLGLVDMFEPDSKKGGCIFLIVIIIVIAAVIYFLPAGSLT